MHGGGRAPAQSPGGPGKGQQQAGRPRDTGQSPSSAIPSIPVLCFLPAVLPSDGSAQGLGLGELNSERNQCVHRALASVFWEGLKDTNGLQGDGHGDEPTGAQGGCRRIAGHVSTIAKFSCEGDGEVGAGRVCSVRTGDLKGSPLPQGLRKDTDDPGERRRHGVPDQRETRPGGLPGRGSILSGDYIPSMKHRARARPSM